jgi:hypothetical protein
MAAQARSALYTLVDDNLPDNTDREITPALLREVSDAIIESAGNVVDDPDVAEAINAASAKTTPHDNDLVGLVDSEASNVLKKLTWANIKAAIWSALGTLINGGTNKATPVGGDLIAIADSADSNNSKKVSLTNLKTFVAPAATDSAAGIVEMATVTEAKARSDTSKAVTPAGLADFARIKTGTYTGDGSTSLAITGVGFQPKVVWIHPRVTSDNTGSAPWLTTDVIIDDNGDGYAMTDGGAQWSGRTNRIISLDVDGFTVDDAGADGHPNQNGVVYNYWAIG